LHYVVRVNAKGCAACFTAAGGDSVRLEAGTHSYPFTFTLPINAPSSFEGEYGYVRYTAEAKMDRPWKFDHVTRSAFTVISLVDCNLQPLEVIVSFLATPCRFVIYFNRKSVQEMTIQK